jgi:hypothetical protein
MRFVVVVPWRGTLWNRGLDTPSFPIQRAAVFRIPRIPLDLAFDGIAADRALVLRVRPLVGISGLVRIRRNRRFVDFVRDTLPLSC